VFDFLFDLFIAWFEFVILVVCLLVSLFVFVVCLCFNCSCDSLFGCLTVC
jgi:hypothetical protein